MSDLIYLDHAATTAVHPDVLKEMLPYFTDKFGNPSSVYGFAANNKNKLTEARETIAGVLGAKPEEIYFTAGGSESDNWAQKPMEYMGDISLRLRLSIMRSCIPVSIWRIEGMM